MDKNKLKKYTKFIYKITKKRLKKEVLKAIKVFKNYNIKEMLNKLN